MPIAEIWTRMFRKTRGRFFTVVFRKNDGTIRTLNGKVKSISRDKFFDGRYIMVWDAKNVGWRKVNVNTILEFRCAELSL